MRTRGLARSAGPVSSNPDRARENGGVIQPVESGRDRQTAPRGSLMAACLESSSTPSGPGGGAVKTWSVGTLVYTRAALISLFGWLLLGRFRPVAEGPLDPVSGAAPAPGTGGIGHPERISHRIAARDHRPVGAAGHRLPFRPSSRPARPAHPLPLPLHAHCGGFDAGTRGESAAEPPGCTLRSRLHSPGLARCTLLFFSLAWTLFEFASIVLAGSLIGAFINDVVPHTLLGRFYGLFRALSLIAGMAFNYWWLGRRRTTRTGCLSAWRWSMAWDSQ